MPGLKALYETAAPSGALHPAVSPVLAGEIVPHNGQPVDGLLGSIAGLTSHYVANLCPGFEVRVEGGTGV